MPVAVEVTRSQYCIVASFPTFEPITTQVVSPNIVIYFIITPVEVIVIGVTAEIVTSSELFVFEIRVNDLSINKVSS